MKLERKILMAMAYRRTTQAAVARAMGTTPSNFNQKLKRETFTLEEMEQMAEVLGGKYRAEFVFEDGTII